MNDPVFLALTAATFLLAGCVKGVIGLGLPTVSLAVLTATVGLEPAMALLLVPSFVTNLWQAVVGGHAWTIAARTWPFLTAATLTVWVGGLALSRIEVAWLSALLGVLLVLYSLVSLSGVRVSLAPGHERWAGPLAGTINGVLTGMTGSFVVPGVLYLQALGLPRDALVQAMGMLFTLSTLALATALAGNRLLTLELGTVSVLAVVPALAGMALGQRLRQGLSEDRFRRVFFASLLVVGVVIVARAVG